MVNALSVGKLVKPKGWEVQSQVELLEPVQREAVRMSLNPQTPKPRANIIIRRGSAPSGSLAKILSGMIKEIGQQTHGFKAESIQLFRFNDGAAGAVATVRFNIDAQLRAVQKHIVRSDHGQLSHLTLTVDQSSEKKLEQLSEMAASFVPGN